MDSVVRDASLPALSVVVPVYNGATVVGTRLTELASHLAALAVPAELIVVDDGSTDDTAERLTVVATAAPVPLRLLRHERNQGKGAAITTGMRAARGAFCVFVDADSAYPPAEISRIYTALTNGADVAVASRVHGDSRLMIRPAYLLYFLLRHVIGRLLNWIVRLSLLPGMRDTQAGLKGFRAEVAERLFRGWLPPGFSFDLALLFRARRLGLSIEQVPIVYQYLREPSTVRFARDTLRMLGDVVQIRVRLIGDHFEHWSGALRARTGLVFAAVRARLASPRARIILVATSGLALLLHIMARHGWEAGWIALGAWLVMLGSFLLLAWRADLMTRAPRGRLFPTGRERTAFLVLLFLCALLRLVWLADLPAMMHGDSAWCGLLGLNLLEGRATDFFAFSEWYYTPYLSFIPYAVSFALTGVTVLGLRLPSALLGILTLVPLYFLVRSWFGVRPALLVGFLYAVGHASIHFSRIGLWNIQVLFYEVAAFALLAGGLRRGKVFPFAIAGALSGVALYSYTGGRLIPLVALAFLALELRRNRCALRGMAYYITGASLAVVPLLANYVRDPGMVWMDRATSVWVLSDAARPHVEASLGVSSPAAILRKQVKRTFQGFVSRGDGSGQYGTEQPLLSPLTALLAALGVLAASRRIREARYRFLLLWTGLGLLLSSILIIDPPSYTRLIMLFPVAYILAVVGLQAALRALSARMRIRGLEVAVVGLLVAGQAAAFDLTGYYRFTQQMATTAREWDVMKVVERLGRRYDYYFYTGPFLLADSSIFRLFSSGTRAVTAFSEVDLPDRLARDTAFVLSPELRRIGLGISARFPGVEREVVEQSGVRQLLIYRCTDENGCRRSRG